MSKLNVVGVIASEHGATLITVDGKSVELKSSNYRTHAVIEAITPIIARRKIAEVDLADFDVAAQVEKKTKGKVRFFRILTSKIKAIFGGSAEREIGAYYEGGFVNSPVSNDTLKQSGVATLDASQIETLVSQNQIVGVPNTTLVAVIDNTPIIGAEALEKQIEAAARVEGVPVGFEKFMSRLASVARERKHTAQELLEFLRCADLPIADDGCIVGYKALKPNNEGEAVYYVDHHSGRVRQSLGTRVEMPVELVDDNRRVLCSNGLHIARRKYLTSYGTAGIVTLVKIAPEDVISVPIGEPDKMRVAAYHIVAELPKEAHGFIRSNQPMTKNEDVQTILGNVIKGNHVGILEVVSATPGGGNTTVVKLATEGPKPAELNPSFKSRVLDDEEAVAKLDPKKLNEQVEKVRQEELSAVSKAAATGDLAAALNAPEPSADPAPAKKSGPALRKKVYAMTKDTYQRTAVMAVLDGMSKREAERKYGVSARTIGRLVKKLNG